MHRTHIGVIALAVGALGGWALAQDPAPDDGAGWTGLTEPEEIIEARRVLMIDVERQMIPIDRFTAGEPADLDALKAAATTMEAMLLAFPHLFPPTTNLYDPAVLEPPTRALPEIWRNFDAFRTLAEAGESAAATMAAADGAEALRTAGRNLRANCDACHAQFARPYTPPQVTQEDLEFDFDAVLPRN
jgi:cytochrome c556